MHFLFYRFSTCGVGILKITIVNQDDAEQWWGFPFTKGRPPALCGSPPKKRFSSVFVMADAPVPVVDLWAMKAMANGLCPRIYSN